MTTAHRLLGIDIGRYALVIGIPPITTAKNGRALTTPTLTIDKRQPDWWKDLHRLEKVGSVPPPDGMSLRAARDTL